MARSPIWNFFEKLDIDRTRALCILCGNTYSLVSDVPKYQSLTGLKNHLKKCHQDQYQVFLESKLAAEAEKTLEIRPAERIKREFAEMESPRMYEVPNFADYDSVSWGESVQNARLEVEGDVLNGDSTYVKKRSGSGVWRYFEKLEIDRSKAVCMECNRMVSLGSDKPKFQTTSGLRSHLKSRHQDKFILLLAGDRHRRVKSSLPSHRESDVQIGDLAGALLISSSSCVCLL